MLTLAAYCLGYCQHTGEDDKREQDIAQVSKVCDIPFPVFVLALPALLLGPAKHHVPTAVPSSNLCCDHPFTKKPACTMCANKHAVKADCLAVSWSMHNTSGYE